MYSKKYIFTEKRIVFICGCLFGMISFLWVYGSNVLDVGYDDWLLGSGDLSQHYLGWKYYRNSKWTFPIGLISNLVYPSKVSVIYTDSIPIFALFFKMLSPILPNRFQYFGIWGLISFMLQGGISAVILKKFTRSNVIPAMGSLFFIFSPVIFQRMFGHTALAGHWVILLNIYIFIYIEKFKGFYKNILIWSLLSALSASIHIYFVPMTFLYLVTFQVIRYIEEKKISKFILNITIPIFSTLITMLILGAFYGNTSFEGGGLGFYNANLNSLFNSQGNSLFFRPILMATDGQYEGYAYIGAGMILLLLIACYNLLNNIEIRRINSYLKGNKNRIAFLVIAFIFFLVALSPKVTLNNKLLFEIPLPNIISNILSIFRASGRFMWPIIYLLMFTIIKIIVNYNKRIVSIITITLCVLIQLIDLSNIKIELSKKFYNKINYESSLNSSFWSEAGKKYDKIIYINNENIMSTSLLTNYYSINLICDIANYAIENSMKTSDFYLARADQVTLKKYKSMQLDLLMNNKPDKNAIYIFENISRFSPLMKNTDLYFYEIDNLIVGLADEITHTGSDDFLEITTASNINLDLSNNYYSNGTVTEIGRILYEKGVSYGPYISVAKGKYEVTIQGEKMNGCSYDVCWQSGENQLEHNEKYQDNEFIVFDIELHEDIADLEVRIFNNQENEVIIKQIKVTEVE